MTGIAIQSCGITMSGRQGMTHHTAKQGHFIVIHDKGWHKGLWRLVMAGFTGIRGLNMSSVFTNGKDAVVATDTVGDDEAVIHGGTQPSGRHMAGITFQNSR